MSEKQKAKRARLWVLGLFVCAVGGLWWIEQTQRRWERWLSRAIEADIRELPLLWKSLPVSVNTLQKTILPQFTSAKQPERLRIAWMLGRAGRLEEGWLRTQLRHPDWRVREAAVFALGRLEKPQQAEIALVGEALRDEKAFVRYRAVLALRRFGAAGQAYLPRLYKELQEGAPTAADLHSHDPHDPHGHSAHEHHRDPRKQQGFFCGKPPDPGWEVRFAILQHLPFLQVEKKQQAAWYRLGLADKDVRVQQIARSALERLGKAAHEALFSGLSMGSLREREHTEQFVLTLQGEALLREMLSRFVHPVGQVWYPVADLLGRWVAQHHKRLKSNEEAMLSASFCRVLSSGDAKKSRFVLRALRHLPQLGLPCVVDLLRTTGQGRLLALQVVGQRLAIKAQSLTANVEESEVAVWLAAVWSVLPAMEVEVWWVFGQAGPLARAWLPKMLAASEMRSRHPYLWLDALVRVGGDSPQIVRLWEDAYQRAATTRPMVKVGNAATTRPMVKAGNAATTGTMVKAGNVGMTGPMVKAGNVGMTGPIVKVGNVGSVGGDVRRGHRGSSGRHRLWRILQHLPQLPSVWDGVLSASIVRAEREEDSEIVEVFARHPKRAQALWLLWGRLLSSTDGALRLLGARILARSGTEPHPSLHTPLVGMLVGSEEEQRAALGAMVRVQANPMLYARMMGTLEQASQRTKIAFLRDLARAWSTKGGVSGRLAAWEAMQGRGVLHTPSKGRGVLHTPSKGRAFGHLAGWGAVQGRLVSFLRGSLVVRNHLQRKGALEVFAALGKEAYAYRADIRGVLRDPSPAVRQAALAALKAMGASVNEAQKAK